MGTAESILFGAICALLWLAWAFRPSFVAKDKPPKSEAELAAEAARRALADVTPTCPICGAWNPERPFIRSAIECHRKDCEGEFP